MIVLDTHALIWMAEGDDRLGMIARHRINHERGGEGTKIAAISLWEAAMLANKDRVGLSRPVGPWFEAVLSTPGFELVPISPAIGVDAGTLPGDIHGDPADRLIIATARAWQCPLMTADRKILAYAQAGHLQAIDARL